MFLEIPVLWITIVFVCERIYVKKIAIFFIYHYCKGLGCLRLLCLYVRSTTIFREFYTLMECIRISYFLIPRTPCLTKILKLRARAISSNCMKKRRKVNQSSNFKSTEKLNDFFSWRQPLSNFNAMQLWKEHRITLTIFDHYCT